MSIKNNNSVSPVDTATQELANSLDDMHALASGALARIHGVAVCALRALETDSGVRDLEAIAQALIAIAGDANSILTDVSCIAGRHGIQTTSESWTKRLAAMGASSTDRSGCY